MFGNLLHLLVLDLQGQLNKHLIIWCVVCKTIYLLKHTNSFTAVQHMYSTFFQYENLVKKKHT